MTETEGDFFVRIIIINKLVPCNSNIYQYLS